MNNRLFFSVIIIAFVAFVPGGVWAGTTVTFTPEVAIPFSADDIDNGQKQYIQFIDSFFNENDKVFPTALVMANTLGYPNGKATIGTFPHFQVGVAAGGGVYKLSRYEDFSEEKPASPFAGANAGFHFGTGITDRFDVTFKVFSLSWFYNAEAEWSKDKDYAYYELKVKDTELITAGVKFRYNLIPGITIIPIFLSFGGINFNVGIDYMKGETNTELTMKDTETIVINSVSVDTGSQYVTKGKIEWNFVSVTPEFLVYMDLLYFLSIYTGPSVSFNTGSLTFNLNGSGDIVVQNPNGTYTTADQKLATMTVESDYKMKPQTMTPKWTLGIEINLLMLKLQVEAVSILNSPVDSGMVQFGTRLQF